MIDAIDTTTGLILGILSAAAALGGAYKVLWHGKKDPNGRRRPGWLKGFFMDMTKFRDSIIGRDPIYDSITGEERVPALPDIGTRMATQEQQMTILTEAVSEMVKNNRRLDDHEERLSALESQRVERVLGKAETIQLLSTMEAVANTETEKRRS